MPAIPPHFSPADPQLCKLIDRFKERTSVRFVAVYPVGEAMIAVNDGRTIDASLILAQEGDGAMLASALVGLPIEAPAVVFDCQTKKCWLAARGDAVAFVNGVTSPRAGIRQSS